MGAGQRIKVLRTEKGVTLPELAERAGVSKGFLSQLENDDKANVSLDTLTKIAKGLGVTVGQLLGLQVAQAKAAEPEKVEPPLAEYIEDRETDGRPVAPDVLRSLYSLKERRGTAKKTKEDWAFLCESIERIHFKK